MRQKWAEQFAALARQYWTDERVHGLTAGKDLAVLPNEAPLLLRALGLLHRDASMPPAQVRKYRQINHMVAALGPSLREMAQKFELVRIVDAGCGRSYLTLLLAHYFEHRLHHPVRIIGIDRNPDIINESRRRAEIAQYGDTVRYEAAGVGEVALGGLWSDIFDEPDTPQTHMLVSLHACDTATDDAIALGVRSRCHFIAVAPCCQAELSGQWAALADSTDAEVGAPGVDGSPEPSGPSAPFGPVWASPHLRRTVAASVTDAMRMVLLAASGYWATAIEFVPSEHTPKNTLIRGAWRSGPVVEKWREYLALRQATGGCGISLESTVRPLF
jgi:Methyltransferase domain